MAAVKLDEKRSRFGGTILREAGPDVALARDERLAGVPDARLVTVPTSDGRVLVPFDRGLPNVIQHPPAAAAGIVAIRLGEQTLPRVRWLPRGWPSFSRRTRLRADCEFSMDRSFVFGPEGLAKHPFAAVCR